MIPVLRLLRVAFELLRFGLALSLSGLPKTRPDRKPSQVLCLSLARLGTVFIKAGQALSLRRHMLPDDYVVALQSLQDNIAPFPARLTTQEIETAFGRHVDEIFSHVDLEPLAAASIAQVHAARLLDGQDVVIKVRRPNIGRQINADMRALSWVANILVRVSPRLRRYQPARIVDEIWNNLRKETDFRQEAHNIKRFANAFADWETVHIPLALEGLISESVIVQQRSGGRRIDDPQLGPDGPRLAQNFVDVYLHQIFVLGLFHGDPHPGNLFITSEGRICFHDFGLVGFLDASKRRRLAALAMAFLRQDADWMLDAGIDLGLFGGTIDRDELRHGLAEIVADFASLPLQEWSLADALLRMARLGQAQNVFIPYDLVVLMRTMFLAENVVRTLDPKFQLLERLQESGSEAFRSALRQSDWTTVVERLEIEILRMAHDLPASLRSITARANQTADGNRPTISTGLEESRDRSERGSNRVALALITLGLYVTGSLLARSGMGLHVDGYSVPMTIAYGLAVWFTFRLIRAIGRSGGL